MDFRFTCCEMERNFSGKNIVRCEDDAKSESGSERKIRTEISVCDTFLSFSSSFHSSNHKPKCILCAVDAFNLMRFNMRPVDRVRQSPHHDSNAKPSKQPKQSERDARCYEATTSAASSSSLMCKVFL